MQRLVLVLACLGFTFGLFAQSQLGWRTDLYAGINSATLNPALPARTPYGWDINLLEGTTFFTNNYTFLQNTNLQDLWRSRFDSPSFYYADELPSDLDESSTYFVFDYLERDQYYVQQLTTVMGPSLSIRVAPLTRVGIFTRFQFMATASDIEEDLGYDRWFSIPEETVFQVDRMRMLAAAWSEVGLNISQGIETYSGVLTIGASVRRLYGQRAAYFISERGFNISKLPGTTGLEGVDFAIDAAFTSNALDTESPGSSPGRGWGFDFGLLYQIDDGEDFNRWELGLAVTDLGSIDFQESERHRYTASDLSLTLTDSYNSLSIDNLFSDATAELSEDLFGAAGTSLVDDQFSVALATTVTAHAAYSFTEWARVEAAAQLSVSPFGARLDRQHLVAVVPRIDRYWYGLALPVSFYGGDQLRMGLSARLGPLFFGTDQLGSLFRSERLQGGDFYAGIKLHPWGLNKNSRRVNRIRGSRRGGKEVECYKF